MGPLANNGRQDAQAGLLAGKKLQTALNDWPLDLLHTHSSPLTKRFLTSCVKIDSNYFHFMALPSGPPASSFGDHCS